MSVKIIVDSTVDLTPEQRAQMSAVVPLSVRFGDDEYKDGVTITAQKFYEMLIASEELPTTSQPTPAAFEEAYAEATADGSEVVVITIASKLSGTYQSATIAAEDFEGKVFVCDSRTAAIGSGVLAEYALRLAQRGMSGQQILDELIAVRKNICLYAIVDTLDYLKKGGRLSATVAAVGGLLNIKPLIYVDEAGEIKVHGMARGMKKACATLTELSVKSDIDYEKPIILGFTGTDPENLRKYMTDYAETWPERTGTTIVGSAIGVHVGPGVVAAAFFKK